MCESGIKQLSFSPEASEQECLVTNRPRHSCWGLALSQPVVNTPIQLHPKVSKLNRSCIDNEQPVAMCVKRFHPTQPNFVSPRGKYNEVGI